MTKRIYVTGAVLVREGLILAAKRGEGKSLGGYWEFPGGKIEAGESPEEALSRELHEELLIDAEVGDFITTTEHEYDFGTVVLSTYYCTLIDGSPKLTEHAEIRWINPSQLNELEWAPADVPTVDIISQGIS